MADDDQGRIPKFSLGGWRELRRRGRWGVGGGVPLATRVGAWGGAVLSPETFLDFASQMATFGAFWALSFAVRMHILHIKSSALDLKSAAKVTSTET